MFSMKLSADYNIKWIKNIEQTEDSTYSIASWRSTTMNSLRSSRFAGKISLYFVNDIVLLKYWHPIFTLNTFRRSLFVTPSKVHPTVLIITVNVNKFRMIRWDFWQNFGTRIETCGLGVDKFIELTTEIAKIFMTRQFNALRSGV